MSRISAIHHVNLEITDIERSKEWYGNVFGVERKDIGTKYADMMVELYTGTGEFHLMKVDNPTYLQTNHVAVEISDWEGMIGHLAELGIPYDGINDPDGQGGPHIRAHDGSNSAYIRDPDGNLIELVHHPRGLVWASPSS
jgi:catechol 2,3-dioxygenase-like lactoylglutathione lyase family enzyme